ncbi:hypothetical protein HPB47_005190 [Ixodes persulcatus]|uniref:Uncharacterized protein n=1 Tax=Ixodes persulcatus TaxID=34615 RepID=A0AC60PE22_IXOPE|nr:hypothetical protein HPB47_005190 [Ixodes persulcatus]
MDLCTTISLPQLAANIKKAEGLHLQVFFSAKTHKEACPFRAIVTERGTWQRQVAAYLQKHLSSLSLSDPFLVRNSEAVVRSLRFEKYGHHEIFSVDVQDLFYSIPHPPLLAAVQSCIESNGELAFRNATGISIEDFLELLIYYLKSTYIGWKDDLYLQKSGWCPAATLCELTRMLRHRKRMLSGKPPGGGPTGVARALLTPQEVKGATLMLSGEAAVLPAESGDSTTTVGVTGWGDSRCGWSICMNCFDFTDIDNVSTTACGHVFHGRCLLPWHGTSKTCPTCRKPLKQREIFKLFFAASESRDEDVGRLRNQLDDAKAKLRAAGEEKIEQQAAADALKASLVQREDEVQQMKEKYMTAKSKLLESNEERGRQK